MAKTITDAAFEAETKEGLVLELLGNLAWSMSHATPILEKLSEELSEDELRNPKNGRG